MADVQQKTSRQAIIGAAERLFAEYGLHGVSLRQINDAAGQRNTSAIQYHFGSREALIEAVFANRMVNINPRREAMLSDMEQSGGMTDIRALVSVLVWPLAEELRPRPDGNHYVQFLARAVREREFAGMLTPEGMTTGWQRAFDALEALIDYLPPEVAAIRLLATGETCINMLATFEANGEGVSPGFRLKVETLIDMATAALQAPLSFETQEALRHGPHS